MFYLSKKLLHLIDEKGNLPSYNSQHVKKSIHEAEAIARRMLGCTLKVRGKKFILTNLELYYGSAGDLASDWYRSNFPNRNAKKVSRVSSEIQFEEGLRIYLNQKGESNYKRMDLVIGPRNVAISLLLRGAVDETGKRVCSRLGNPNKLLKAMGIVDADHGRSFKKSGDLVFLDTHDQYVKDSSQILTNLRVIGGKATGFQNTQFGQSLWNFSIILTKPHLDK
jgi:3-methyladenine DNA glycosylase Mpg